MAKIELKGFVHQVGKVQDVPTSTGTMQKQIVLFKVPPYRDDYGDERGKEEYWKLEVIGDNVGKLNLNGDVNGKKAMATVYVNSTYLPEQDGRKEMYIVNLVLGKLELKQ